MFPSLRRQTRWNIVVGKRSYREAAALFAFQLSINTLSLHAKKFVSQTSQERKRVSSDKAKASQVCRNSQFRPCCFLQKIIICTHNMSRALVAVVADTIAIIGRGENNALSDTLSKQTCDTRHEPIVNTNYVKWNRIKRPIVVKFSLYAREQ